MNKVVTVNLNGNAFALEEPAYEALRAYLDGANARLNGNPDRAEIMADLEQAIADKCRRHLGPQKNVVGSAEMSAILEDMGPVEAEPAADAQTAPPRDNRAQPEATPRRLYLIREGAMIGGVCTGLAAYFNIDVAFVRIGFVAATLLTGGFWILAYIIMMFVVPKAETDEERAAAHGLPFNAQELVDRAKQHYAELREQGSRWQDDWRRRRRARRRQRAAEREREFWRSASELEYQDYGTRVAAGFLVPVFTALSAFLFVVMVLMVLSLVMTGGILDWTLPGDVPVWAAVLVVVLAYHAVLIPLRAASRASYEATAGPRHGWIAAADGLLWVGFAVLLFWIAWETSPEVRDLLEDMQRGWRQYALAWTRW